MKYSLLPGVFDILPDHKRDPWCSSHLWNHVESVIRDTLKDYCYREMRTPIFERTELFLRGVGETSDIVSKEMYTFDDKGGRSVSLRPEGTAPSIRAYIENQLHQTSPIQKLFYIGPMFRYERSQAGRYRQHHQFGAEAIGIGSAEQDVELIDLLYTIYNRLGLKNLQLQLNSIGNISCRLTFKEALKGYLQNYFNQLSEDSQSRFEKNPLRILDSKDPKDIEITSKAPSILNFLDEESQEHFEEVKKYLDILKIPYQINPRLVRGLDYYNKTVFEITAGELGAQNSLGGGGRYDGLIKTLGGPDLPAMGFGSGIERVIQTMLKQNIQISSPYHPKLFLIPLGDEAKNTCYELLHLLRENGIPTEMDFSEKKLNKAMQYANQIQATYVAVIGDEELQTHIVELKEMETGHKTKVPLAHLSKILRLELKEPEFLKMWDDVFRPFEDQVTADFFIHKLDRMIDNTKLLADNLHQAVDKIKEILK